MEEIDFRDIQQEPVQRRLVHLQKQAAHAENEADGECRDSAGGVNPRPHDADQEYRCYGRRNAGLYAVDIGK
ncbi:MAG: hypothetical protein P8X53_11680 [Chromatiales bacterium]